MLVFTVFAHPKALLWILAVYMLQISEKESKQKTKRERVREKEKKKKKRGSNVKQAGLSVKSSDCCFQH